MNRSLRWLLAALLGLASCDPDQQRAYDYARHEAVQQPTYTGPIGAGLHLGMPQAQAEHQLDSLAAVDALVWHLSTGTLPIRAYPDYQGGQLIGLQLVLVGDGLQNGAQCLELQGQLRQACGGPGYEHDPGREDTTWTWFRGGTEISLTNAVGEGFQLTYTDVHSEAALIVHRLAAQTKSIIRA